MSVNHNCVEHKAANQIITTLIHRSNQMQHVSAEACIVVILLQTTRVVMSTLLTNQTPTATGHDTSVKHNDPKPGGAGGTRLNAL